MPISKRLADYEVNGHESRLGQVLSNLLDNARSFAPDNSEITIGIERVGAEVEIAVEDEGPGIPAENLEKVFQRFYTDRPGVESFGKNSGLGLNISRQIVLAHGGRIWFEQVKGQGSAPPLLLYGHVDVQITTGQTWQHPPFDGQIVDGYIWGRGAMDMKGGVAMMLAAFLKAKAEGLKPAGDVVLAILSDEEQFGDLLLFLVRVSGNADHFHSVPQSGRNWVKLVGGGDEGHVAQIKGDIQVMVHKTVVLLRIQDLQ